MNHSLKGRSVVITGAARDLGKALALSFAAQGMNLILCGRNVDALNGLQQMILDNYDITVLVVEMDLANRDSIEAGCEFIRQQKTTIDLLINNGAKWQEGSLLDCAADDVYETLMSAAMGTVMVTKGLLPLLLASPKADIVNIVSRAGLLFAYRGNASAAFHAGKHAQSGFSDALRDELVGENIRVTAIYPPDFDTVIPGSEDWDTAGSRDIDQKMTGRQVIETILFVLSQPRCFSLPTIIMDNTKP